MNSPDTSPSRTGGHVVSDVVPDTALLPTGDPRPTYAAWWQRVLAALLDDAVLAGVTWLALGTGVAQPTLTPYLGPDGDGWPSSPLVLVPVGAVALLLVLQGTTGWTPGKLVVGIRVVDERLAGPAGVWTTLARWALHLLDALLLIGYLRPLWHRKRQTFADAIVGTVVVPALPDLPHRPRVLVHAAALVVVVLGLGYGCVPLSSASVSTVVEPAACDADGAGPALTTGEIRLGGSVAVDQERRLWTVREHRTALPGAMLTWVSAPSARDVRYRVELDARPASGDGPRVSRSWNLGTGERADLSESGQITHSRRLAPDGDLHEAQVEVAEAAGLPGPRSTELWIRVRLLADGAVVADCERPVGYAH
ncbi:RDD family protein [Promicromonospora sp. NPDC050880]|uniref:RDD family protein n=1 Tax=Promicromonospora sp. NPDC050880 TaxID=3364406 RepID=UPI0037A80E57